MKKQWLVLGMLLMGVMASLQAKIFDPEEFSFNFFNDELKFQLLTDEPLHQVYAADLWSASSRFQSIQVDGYGPSAIRASVKRDPEATVDDYPNATEETLTYDYVYQDIYFQEANSDSLYYLMKIGINAGLLRTTWAGNSWIPPISAELSLQGALNLVFNATGGTDMLGSDGIYFVGGNMSIGDAITLRAGIHHFSGHYGDEILERLYTYADNYALFEPGTTGTVDHVKRVLNYVRQDTFILGLSYRPFSWLRLYAEADIPPKSLLTIRPWVHVPEGTEDKEDGADMVDKIGGQEGNSGGRHTGDTYDSSYRALRLETGMELRFPVPYVGDLIIACDVQFHQDGQTKHQVGAYSSDNPWDIEYNILVGQTLGRSVSGIEFSLEYTYHSGRFPLTNFFYYTCEYHSIGIGMKF